MLKIALPNKGSLAEESMRLMTEAGYTCRRSQKELFVHDKENEIDFIFLRPRDIAIYVSRGILDLGLTGRDLASEARADVKELLCLGFGRSRFCYAVPEDKNITPFDFSGLKIATSFPHLVSQDLKKKKIESEIITLDGAVEISIHLGVADVIADVIETGRTMKKAGLKVVGDPVLVSEAVVIARNSNLSLSPSIECCINRLRGIIMARDYVMIEYDAPQDILDAASIITPGIESPTIAPLSKSGWVAVKAMVKRKGINTIMDRLSHIGAKGIIVMDIRACRL